MTEEQIYEWLENTGRKIAEHAAPLSQMGGDHPYDGAIEVIWQEIHKTLGVHEPDCYADAPKKNCALHDR